MTNASTTKDYYAILGVSPTAEAVVISAAYRELAKKYHPDKWRGDRSVGEARMRELNEAYKELSNEQRRREYDRDRNLTVDYNNANDFASRDAKQSQQSAKEAARKEEMRKGVVALGLITVIFIRRAAFSAFAIVIVLAVGLGLFEWATGR